MTWGCRARAKFVLHDRDASFTQAFDAVFQAVGIRVIRSAVQAPRMKLGCILHLLGRCACSVSSWSDGTGGV